MHGARAVVALDDLADRARAPSRGVAPAASASPKRRLRDLSSVQVRTRSPMPARPMNVSLRPPSASPKRVISARPRAIERDARIRAEAEAVADAGADRVDVLRGAADLDADDVVRGVSAKRVAADALGEALRVIGVRRRDRHRRRQARADLARERRSREHGRRQAGRQQLPARPGTAAARYRARSLWWPRRGGAAAARRAPSASRAARGSARRPARHRPCVTAARRSAVDLERARGTRCRGGSARCAARAASRRRGRASRAQSAAG